MKPEFHSPGSVPEYPLPETTAHFLASEDSLYDYGNLYQFTGWFRDQFYDKSTQDKPFVVISDSSDEQVFAIAACWLLGIPFSPLSPNQPEKDLKRQIRQLNPNVLYCDPKYEDILQDNKSIAIRKKHLKLPSNNNKPSFPKHKPEKIMGFFTTSGSTAKPKIVPLKRRQMYYAARANEQNFKPKPNHYWLLCLPLNHVGGVSIILRTILYGTAIYRMDKFEEYQVVNFLSENKLFQVASLVPTMLHRLLSNSQFQAHLELKAILLGGGRVPPSLIQNSIERGLPIVQSYGMTETCAQIAANVLLKPKGTYTPKKSVGHVFFPNEIEIRNDNNQPLKMNESGIIWLRGPQVFDGYFNKKHNRDAFDGRGWFNTGDYGHINTFGHLFIETRRSDLIVTGGENVDPAEVESALESLEEVGRAAVVGIPDEEWGEQIIAFVEPVRVESNSEGLDQINFRLNEILPAFKIPKEIYSIKTLPKTESGKIKRNELKDLYFKTTRSQSP